MLIVSLLNYGYVKNLYFGSLAFDPFAARGIQG